MKAKKQVAEKATVKVKSKKTTFKNKKSQSGFRRNMMPEEIEEEAQLTALLFGDNIAPSSSSRANAAPSLPESSLFYIDTKPSTAGQVETQNDGNSKMDSIMGEMDGRKAAWEDADDNQVGVSTLAANRLRKLRTTADEDVLPALEYQRRLRKQFEKINRRPRWAGLPETAGGADSDDVLLRSSARLVASRPSALPPSTIDVSRLKDANIAEPSQAVVRSVQFHPSTPLLLTAGLDKKIRIFQVDGTRNTKVQSVHLDDLPIHTAQFSPDGSRVVAAGRRPFLYVYDLPAARVSKISRIAGRAEKSWESFALSRDGQYVALRGVDGYIVLACLRTFRWIANLRCSVSVNAIAFSPDSSFLYATTTDSQLYVWDMRTRQCISKVPDQGTIKSTALAASSTHLATGCVSGVVNVYDCSALASAGISAGGVKPVKSLMHLTTAATTLRFSGAGDVLAFASMEKQDCLRLAHMESLTVFSNWPSQRTPLGYVSAVDFSRGGGLVAIGNARGKVLLYRLNYYEQW